MIKTLSTDSNSTNTQSKWFVHFLEEKTHLWTISTTSGVHCPSFHSAYCIQKKKPEALSIRIISLFASILDLAGLQNDQIIIPFVFLFFFFVVVVGLSPSTHTNLQASMVCQIKPTMVMCKDIAASLLQQQR